MSDKNRGEDSERKGFAEKQNEAADTAMDAFEEQSESEDDGSPSADPDTESRRVTGVQSVINSLEDATESAREGKETEKEQLGGPGGESVQGGLLEEAAETGREIREAQRAHDDNLQDVNTSASELDSELRDKAREESSAAVEVADIQDELDSRVEGVESGEEVRFGIIESIMNTQFLAQEVKSARGAEATSTTFGENMSSAMGENIQGTIKQLHKWAGEFYKDRKKAEELTSDAEEELGLEEKLEDYENAVEDYEDARSIDDFLETLGRIESNSVGEIGSSVGDEHNQPDDELVERAARLAADADEQMNGADNPKERFEPQNEEFESAVDFVRYAQATAIDRVAANRDRLNEAVDKVESTREEIQGLRSDLATYKSEVEDLENIDGVGESFAGTLDELGAETVMDVALMGEMNVEAGPEFQRKIQTESQSVPDMNDIRDAAYEALTEISEEMDYLSVDATGTMKGTDLSPDRANRRAAQALYDSVNSLDSTLATLEDNLPDTDQYQPDWDGREGTLEAERQDVYERAGDTDMPEAEEALGV